MKLLRVALALLLLANIGSVLITNAPIDSAVFGQKPFHAHTMFEIKGEPDDASHWSSAWGPNRPGNPQHQTETEIELSIAHGVRGELQFVYVEILADSQEDADAVMSLLENDFKQSYRPRDQFHDHRGIQHIEEPYDNHRLFWRQRFELLLIANIVAIFGILIISIFCARKPSSPKNPVNAA